MSGIHAEAPPPIVSEPHGVSYATGPQLGKGGFAICHRAERYDGSRPTGRLVALKIVKTKMEPAKLAQKFVTELQIHSKLAHPNIVTFYRAFSVQANTYVVLELCPNGSLADMLKKRRTLTLPEIRRFVIQICGAVKYLHHRHIVHRDLKTGNLFLDGDMNIKVGDFGLAALLVTTEEMEMKRRTTMCGTPNYLAPEILEKGKGHNEKVDLWAIGVIAYTLAVGKAPFHASTKEEIYKKLKSGTYSWPELSGSANQSSDLHDLVSSLLVSEEQRPIPDQIVSQNFFKLGFVPATIPAGAREKAIRWGDIPLPTAEAQRRGYTDSWYAACKEAGVGTPEPGKSFRLPGGKARSIVHALVQEEKLGQVPTMPIPSDTVYVSPVSHWDPPSSNGPTVVDLTSDESQPSSARSGLKEISQNEVHTTRPAVVRSIAAREKIVRDAALMPPPVRKGARTISEEAAKQTKLKVPSRPPTPADAAPAQAPKAASTLAPRLARRPKPSVPKENVKEEPAVTKEPPDEAAGPCENALTLPAPPRMLSRRLPVPQRSAAPDPEAVVGTDPDTVLDKLTIFRDNLSDAINNAVRTRLSSTEAEGLPFVSRWVDYSRKHGIGYILSDGTIGCVLNATSKHGGTPVTHVLVRNGQKWLAKVGKNLERSDSVPLEVFEDCGTAGIRKKVYKGLGSVGEGPLKEEDDRRRMLRTLWVKFGRYMSKSLEVGELDQQSEKSNNFVRFYQRIGDVGMWVFKDGCIQVHFPDHTKFVLSSDGAHISATCITTEATTYLARNSALLPHHVSSREIFADSVSALLNDGGRVRARIIRSNSVRDKLSYLLRVVDQWIGNGGLGRLDGDEGCRSIAPGESMLRWEGVGTEKERKDDCVCVGRYGGDLAAT